MQSSEEAIARMTKCQNNAPHTNACADICSPIRVDDPSATNPHGMDIQANQAKLTLEAYK